MQFSIIRLLVAVSSVAVVIGFWRFCMAAGPPPADAIIIVACFSASGAMLGAGIGALLKQLWIGALIGLVSTGGTASIVLIVERVGR